MAASSAPSQSQQCRGEEGNNDGEAFIYYFGYGPMVHPSVRQRRCVHVEEERAAILPDYRLTFAYGGAASVVRQLGYEVHGILMRCRTCADWDKMKSFEKGFYETVVDVYPCDENDGDKDDENEETDHQPTQQQKLQKSVLQDAEGENDKAWQQLLDRQLNDRQSVRAYCFVMLEFDESRLLMPIEKLPSERYLRLIASGLRHYGVDEDYIQDQVMGVPFLPRRKPEDYWTFPPLPNGQEQLLPRISLEGYKRLCHDEASRHRFFVVGKHVILMGEHDPAHPGAVWLQSHGFGKADVTFALHQNFADPDIPYCEVPERITPTLQSWAEDFLVEFCRQCGFTAHRVLALTSNASDHDQAGIDKLLASLRTLHMAALITKAAPVACDSRTSIDDDSDEVDEATPDNRFCSCLRRLWKGADR